jgi:predicted lipid-binding transport protein (Tim44 family)
MKAVLGIGALIAAIKQDSKRISQNMFIVNIIRTYIGLSALIVHIKRRGRKN